MDLGLKSKVVVITGGSGAIGRAAALQFIQQGASVAICGRRADAVAAAVEELKRAGGDVMGIAADVGNGTDIDRFMAAVVERYGRVDVLVNGAGDGMRAEFLTLDDDAWNSDLQVKLLGAVRCIRLAVPLMRKQGGGRIINVSSIGGKQPFAESCPAAISRAAGLALTKVLAKEFAADNILVNVVCLGKIRSPQQEKGVDRAVTDMDRYYAKKSESAGIPVGRYGEPREAANVIVFLASELASYVTGTSINVDGGLCSVL